MGNKKSEEVVNEIKSYKVIQIGAYKEYEYALNEITNVGGIIVYDNNYYYVYYAILSNTINLERLSQILTNKNIYYYIKDINIANENYKDLVDNYETLMLNTTTDLAFITLNNKLINLYEGKYEN